MDLENDKRYPKYETLYAWVKALSIPPHQVFDGKTDDDEAERFYEQLMNCGEGDRSIIIETARTLMQRLKETK